MGWMDGFSPQQPNESSESDACESGLGGWNKFQISAASVVFFNFSFAADDLTNFLGCGDEPDTIEEEGTD